MTTVTPIPPAPADWRVAARDRMSACVEALFDEIDRLTHDDPLTRLPNRFSLDLQLRELVEGAPESGRAVVLDLDRFQLVFEPAMWTAAAERMALDRDLRRALDRDEIAVAYQPQVELASGRIVGVEALARWTHPTRGVIAPAVFVTVAEQNGSIGRLTDRVLDQACRDIAALRARGVDLRVAVNLSARELSGKDLADRVCRGLDAHGLAPATLDVEVTEGTLIRDVDESAAALAALRRRGVQVSVDDFGTGYSSLAFLRRFPLDILKIDRSFIESIDAPGGDGGAIAELIVGLGRALGARVIAEGVESATQIERLRELGCDEAQGYAFSPPLAFAELAALLLAAT